MRHRWIAAAATLAIALAKPVAAQSIHITPTLGAYHPGSDPIDLTDRGTRLVRGNALGLGLNLEAGFFRGTIAYASGATIKEEGVGASGDVGDGRLLAFSGGLVLRPIPRIIGIQPYALGGAGLKRQDYSFDDDGFSNALPKDKTDFALHAGLGADLMLGSLGFMAEVTDFIASDYDDSRRHDTFLMFGMRLRLGGR
jgi:hypothetical protein